MGHLDNAVCAGLQARSQSIEALAKVERDEKKEGGRDLPWEVLEPFRVAYNSARYRNRVARAALLARVVMAITGGG